MTVERAFWESGLLRVAGVDEVGRGAMAGPLVAAAVVLPAGLTPSSAEALAGLADIRDSKLLSDRQRRRLLPIICSSARAVAVGMVEADELDLIGVACANRLAMERAVRALPCEPDALLLDAIVLDLELPQVGIIDGDARCLSIAAASIVAKVTRDRVMIEAQDADDRFGFSAHKGYGTPAHLAALRRHGPCPLHRRSFAPVAQAAGGCRA